MRDGVRLAATVWLPEPRGRHPVLLARTPYGRGPYGPGLRLDVTRLLSAGYAVMVQDVRGTGESEGDLRFLTGEAADGHDTVTWAARQAWCDGQAGRFGDSYLGIAQLLAVSERPDGPRAIAPSVSPAGLHDVVYAGGVLRLGVVLPVLATVIAPLQLARRARLDPGEKGLPAAPAARLGEMLRRLPVGDQPEITDLFPFYADWLAHPDPSDELWRDADLEARYDKIEVPALLSSGWYDYFRDSTIRTYRALRGRARLVVGHWTHALRERTLAGHDYGEHASGEAVDWTGLHLDWFGHWMRGTPLKDDAKVRVFVTGACEWRAMAGWPPEDEAAVRYHLGGAGTQRRPARSCRRQRCAPPSCTTTAIPSRPWAATARPGRVRVLLGNLAHVFGAGHRVRVEVAGSDFPKYARHPDSARITISAPSYLLLPATGRPRSSRDAVRPRS
ncbi:CocE/NonD family hydrolase [Microbispora sp. NEAU-D428]|uniref:CocE/NonD family hydrolase n=1 Tax=Microbispora sitophila TaxID=2771537 RepID=UPI001867A8CF|nr:CocE/NonD family hydrolase [Microbispora sitophila]MBE3015441.1 CocE/NonD family hydrolase [Microbispora sitophila]